LGGAAFFESGKGRCFGAARTAFQAGPRGKLFAAGAAAAAPRAAPAPF